MLLIRQIPIILLIILGQTACGFSPDVQDREEAVLRTTHNGYSLRTHKWDPRTIPAKAVTLSILHFTQHTIKL